VERSTKILDDTHPTYDDAHCSKDDQQSSGRRDFKVDHEPFPLKTEFLSRNQPKPQTCAVADVLKNGRNLPENPFRYYSKFNAEVPTISTYLTNILHTKKFMDFVDRVPN